MTFAPRCATSSDERCQGEAKPSPAGALDQMDEDATRSQLAAALARVAGGDHAALRIVYQDTSAKLFGVCLRILKDRSEAEDVLQDVYVERVELAQQHQRLAHCLGELDARHSTAIRAAFLDGATYEELAARMNVPLGTMKSWIRRGLLKLRACLER
jgi:DNA-directed RNA polymerase specialized sigma24 family protein